MTVLRDIRVVDPDPGVLELASVRTADAARVTVGEPRFDRPGSNSDRSGIVTVRSMLSPTARRVVNSAAADLERVHGVGEVIATRLRNDGFRSVGDVVAADREDLTDVTGIGAVRAEGIQRSAARVLEETGTR
ncbi:hypothetical protein GRS48_11235 [Halorubrum sp. JWXQ-INN 858]|uniref:helix-hairpin-helix domain-containing protein n=1 Tax=Halorubrum sp. JWXQ-INN 858 TaxID=2690782 RepID=UPI0013581269|nr:helix-hairpin-helix domain-containing protein [Halorubrum sp. JWXQ-INN 858]MWV65385.1 hypothetical protein [Halorubrum sp. JWXQ-INN 858]